MEMINVELNEYEFYFLTNLIGASSVASMRDYIKDISVKHDVDESIRDTMLVCVEQGNKYFPTGDVLESIYAKLQTEHAKRPVITKYKVLYSHPNSKDEWYVSEDYYASLDEFKNSVYACNPVMLIKESAKQFGGVFNG